MKEEDIRNFMFKFKGQILIVTCQFGSTILTYTGTIASLQEDSLLFIDKFGKSVLISLDALKKIETTERVGLHE